MQDNGFGLKQGSVIGNINADKEFAACMKMEQEESERRKNK